jgi:hypothetical protein
MTVQHQRKIPFFRPGARLSAAGLRGLCASGRLTVFCDIFFLPSQSFGTPQNKKSIQNRMDFIILTCW